MAGINSNTLVFGVLDLIKKEIRRNNAVGSMYESTELQDDAAGGPLDGVPSVILNREHPLDPDTLTGAFLYYPSEWRVEIYMGLGMSAEQMQVGIAKNNEVPNVDDNVLVPEGDELDSFSQLTLEEQLAYRNESVPVTELHPFEGDYAPRVPDEVTGESHPDYDFLLNYRLHQVTFEVYNQINQLKNSYIIYLQYDYKGLLVGTVVESLMPATDVDPGH